MRRDGGGWYIVLPRGSACVASVSSPAPVAYSVPVLKMPRVVSVSSPRKPASSESAI